MNPLLAYIPVFVHSSTNATMTPAELAEFRHYMSLALLISLAAMALLVLISYWLGRKP